MEAYFTETNNAKYTARAKNRRLAGAYLACLASLGLGLVYLDRSHFAMPSPPPALQEGYVSRDPAICIIATDAVIPNNVWRRIMARYGDDEAGMVREIQASRYITSKRKVISENEGRAVMARSFTPITRGVRNREISFEASPAADIRSLSVAPHINPGGTISISVVSAHTSPSSLCYLPGGSHSEQDSTIVTLKNGGTRIVWFSQASANAPVWVTLLTARTLGFPRKMSVFMLASRAPRPYSPSGTPDQVIKKPGK